MYIYAHTQLYALSVFTHEKAEKAAARKNRDEGIGAGKKCIAVCFLLLLLLLLSYESVSCGIVLLMEFRVVIE